MLKIKYIIPQEKRKYYPHNKEVKAAANVGLCILALASLGVKMTLILGEFLAPKWRCEKATPS